MIYHDNEVKILTKLLFGVHVMGEAVRACIILNCFVLNISKSIVLQIHGVVCDFKFKLIEFG